MDAETFIIGFLAGAACWAFGAWLSKGDLFGRPHLRARRVVSRSGRNPRRSSEPPASDDELKRLRKMTGLE